MGRRTVVVPESQEPAGVFVPTRAQREYLRAVLDDARGTMVDHAKAACVNRATVYRWLQDQRFVAWVRSNEQRAATGYANSMLLRLKEIGLGSGTKHSVAIRAIDVYMKNLPGKRDDGADLAIRAILQDLIRAPSVTVTVNNAVGVNGAGRSIEEAALKAGVLSMTRDVGPVEQIAAPVESVRAVAPEPEAPHVQAAMRELDELEGKVEPTPLPDEKPDPWAGVRRGKVEEVTLPEGDE